MLKGNQTILRLMMALAIAFGVEATASAQLGGLLKKAKQSVTDKVKKTISDTKEEATTSVRQQVEQTAEETTDVNIGSSDESAPSENNTQSANYSEEELPLASQTSWTINGDQKAIAQQAEYLALQMQNSMKKGWQGLDFKSYCELKLSAQPLLFVIDARIELGGYTWDMKQSKPRIENVVWNFKNVAWNGMPGKMTSEVPLTLQQTQFIIDRGLTFSDPVARAAYFDMAYTYMQIVMDKVNGSESEWAGVESGLNKLFSTMDAQYRERFPFTTVTLDNVKANNTSGSKMKKKMMLLIAYIDAAKDGQYGTMPASQNASYEKNVLDEIRVHRSWWGTPVKASVSGVTSTRKNKLGVVTHRHRQVTVLCEDQGYKVIREFTMSEEAQGNNSWGGFRLTGASYEQDVPVKLMK